MIDLKSVCGGLLVKPCTVSRSGTPCGAPSSSSSRAPGGETEGVLTTQFSNQSWMGNANGAGDGNNATAQSNQGGPFRWRVRHKWDHFVMDCRYGALIGSNRRGP